MQYTIWGEEMPESIGGFSSQSSSVMHDVQTLSAGQMLQKEAKGWRMQEASTPLLASRRALFFSRNSPQKWEKKHCCVEFAVVNFVGRIKTTIKKVFSDLLDL